MAPLVTQPVAIFMVVLAIILFAPLLLNRFKIPNIIGLIIAGVAVGPYGFNVLARDMSFEVFGQVGLLYLMFLAGLEIDLYHLKKNLGKGITFGLYTFFIPLVAGYVASRYLLGLDALASMLAATLFSAHTLIGYPIISRFGLTKSPAVIIAITGTIVTVLASLVVLASVAGVYHEGAFSLPSTLKLLGSLGLFCAVIAYAYPRVTRWFLKTHSDAVAQFVYILFMAFLASTVAMLIGIEGVFGAFYSGLILNRYIPAKSSLMARIEFAGNSIFIPYFLIGVGMLINIGVISEGLSTIYVACVISAVAMAAKWLAAFAAQLSFSMGRIDRSVMYQLSNAHTAVALAVVMIGYEAGAFSDDILNGTILMILITCTVASLGVGRAANRLALHTHHHAGSPGEAAKASPTSHALISIGTPEAAKQIVGLAVLMRNTATKDNKLYALHVRSDNSAASRALGRESLARAEEAATATNTPITAIERYDLNVVTGMLNTIAERDISAIYLGLHRKAGYIDSFFGNKIQQLLRSTNHMVVMSRTFIPLNTLLRIRVIVPQKAQLETGFSRWVEAVANLTRQVGCRVTFYCDNDTETAITSVLLHKRYGISYSFSTMESNDEYVLLSGETRPDDLTIFIFARRASVSFNPSLDEIPEFISRYFTESNVIVLYPEQFGAAPEIPSIAVAMTPDIISQPSRIWVGITSLFRRKRL